jgi:LuxR family maltose regulon positive regulatory protein
VWVARGTLPVAVASGRALPRPQPLPEPLSDREIEVLRLVALGRSNAEIARELVVEVATVKAHLNNLYRKLDVHSRTQAVARAGQLRLLQAR